jgi:hypothetical protein
VTDCAQVMKHARPDTGNRSRVRPPAPTDDRSGEGRGTGLAAERWEFEGVGDE